MLSSTSDNKKSRSRQIVTSLYALAERCGYGALHSEMIRDRLAGRIRDKRLSELLQMDADLMLDKAVIKICKSKLFRSSWTF